MVVCFTIISKLAVTARISVNNVRADLFLKGIFPNNKFSLHGDWKITLSLQNFQYYFLFYKNFIWVLFNTEINKTFGITIIFKNSLWLVNFLMKKFKIWTFSSAIGTPTYKLLTFLVPMLEPLTTNEYTIKDSFTFAKELQNFDSKLVMVSFDIESLFTNIPFQEK